MSAAVWDVIHGCTGYWAAAAGVRLGVFDALDGGALDATVLASRCGAQAGPTAVLADALVATGLLVRDGSAYALSGPAAAHLVRGKPAGMADLLVWSPGPPPNWPALPDRARGARPPSPVDAAFYVQLVDATLPSQLAVARAVLPGLGLPAGARLLELGAGRAPWSCALLAADAGATAVVNDLEGVLDGTPAALGASAARCTFIAGDYLAVALPSASFDLVVLGHVLRAEPDDRARQLVARAASVGTRVVITEYLGGRDPGAFPQAALLGLTMLAATVDGRLCTVDVIEAWLRDAGLPRTDVPPAVAGTDIVIGARHA